MDLGLPVDTVVTTGIIDAHAGGVALLGAAPEGGLAIISGISCCQLVVSRQAVMVLGIWGPYFGAMLPGWWLNEGGQSAAGALIDWTLRQHDARHALQSAATEAGRSVFEVASDCVAALQAREAEPTRHLHVLADHHGNRSPRAYPLARGIVAGLTLEHGPDALARQYLATVQALAYDTRHIIDSLKAAGHRITRVVLTGGGARTALLLREHADATGCDLHLGSEEQAVTLGAAILAATASGAFADLPAAAASMAHAGGTIRADPARRAFHDAKYAVHLALYDDWCHYQRMMIAYTSPAKGALSQSALLAEMAAVPPELREECLCWYESRGMTFAFGGDPATELTRAQVLEQCAMLIALGRFVRHFGPIAVGVQYQQGLARSCAASDFAEGAVGSAERFQIPDLDGTIVRPGEAIPCINEVDMGSGIPQTMLWPLLTSLGLPAETTLHDVRWGSEFDGKFYWDLEFSGAVPFAHLKGGIAGATGYRQPPMYFPMGGATIAGQCDAGSFVWARAHYEGTEMIMHIGTGHAVELPEAEFERRRRATTYQWPLVNAVLDGVGRDDLMAWHQSNHLTVAYVSQDQLRDVACAFVAQALTQGISVFAAGTVSAWL